MRLNYTSKSERKKKFMIWHKWFAWYPVNIPEEKCWVWLETIERELYYTSREVGLQYFAGYNWKYRTRTIEHGEVY